MQALAVIDMQRWMFQRQERAAQLAGLLPPINKLTADFVLAGLPVFDVRVIHKADRSTWSRLMLKYDMPCLEVVIVEDAIAYCEDGHRVALIEWLIAMYELTIMKADAVRVAS